MKLRMMGRLNQCILLSYRTPADTVRGLLPRGLHLLTHGGFAFWNIVASEIERMRPTGFPHFVGTTYRHVAYRLHAQARLNDGSTVTGLYFVRSDADNRWICLTGNAMTEFRFHHAQIDLRTRDDRTTLRLLAKGADACFEAFEGPTQPIESCFASAKESQEFLKYHPAGLSTDGRLLKIAQVYRDDAGWKELPLRVVESRWDFLHHLGQHDLHLEKATRVQPLQYRWQLGCERFLAGKEGFIAAMTPRSLRGELSFLV